MLCGQVAAAHIVRVDRGKTAPVHVHQHQRLADLLQRGQHLRLEEAGAHDRVGLVQPDLPQHRLRRVDRDEGQGNALAPARHFRALQHRRVERARCQRIVLAVQQEGDAADAPLLQLAEVIAQLQRGLAHLVARRLGHAGLVLQRARHRADRQPGGVRNAAQGDLGHDCRLREIMCMKKSPIIGLLNASGGNSATRLS